MLLRHRRRCHDEPAASPGLIDRPRRIQGTRRETRSSRERTRRRRRSLRCESSSYYARRPSSNQGPHVTHYCVLQSCLTSEPAPSLICVFTNSKPGLLRFLIPSRRRRSVCQWNYSIKAITVPFLIQRRTIVHRWLALAEQFSRITIIFFGLVVVELCDLSHSQPFLHHFCYGEERSFIVG